MFCCKGLKGAIDFFNTPIRYISRYREYRIKDQGFNDDEELFVSSKLLYCPWCGEKFSKSLFNSWKREIAIQFGVVDILNKEELKKIPKEYMTDEWWKKKGL